MSDYPSIHEVAHMMTSEEHITKDFEDILSGLKDMVYNKYIGTLESAIQAQHERTKNNATKEVQLLEAMKPFVDSNQHSTVDQLIKTMQAMNTIQALRNDLQRYWNSSSKSIDHLYRQDGVYEIDEECMKRNILGTGNVQGDMIMLLSVLLLLKEI